MSWKPSIARALLCTGLWIVAVGVPGVGIQAQPGIPGVDSSLPFEVDPIAAAQQGPEQVGEEILLTVESPARMGSGTASTAPVWKYELTDPGASYIAPHFASMSLPEGAELVLRSPDGSRSWTYTGSGKIVPGATGFWGLHIPGETAVLEIFSAKPLPQGAVRLDSYARGFPESFPPSEPEALCGPDDSLWAKCYGGTMYNKSRAVARLLINGVSACTGWLVGPNGHLMTNEHCIGSASAAANTNYEFMAEGSSCSTNCASWFACPGTVVATSASLVKLNASLDYALVQLPTNPSGTYGSFQLDACGASIGDQIYIPQHPAAWGKRIARASSHSLDGGTCRVSSLTEVACSGGPGDVGYYCDTQGGSSGSPVVRYSDHYVIALHHCRGNPTCTNSGGQENRGVPIDAIIADLGSLLPSSAVVNTCAANLNLTATPYYQVPFSVGLSANWSSIPGATSYRVTHYRQDACGSASHTSTTTGLSSGSGTHNNCGAPDSCYYREATVEALDSGGNVITSEAASFCEVGPPPPLNLTATAYFQSGYRVGLSGNWSAVQGAANYRVTHYRQDACGSASHTSTTTGTSSGSGAHPNCGAPSQCYYKRITVEAISAQGTSFITESADLCEIGNP